MKGNKDYTVVDISGDQSTTFCFSHLTQLLWYKIKRFTDFLIECYANVFREILCCMHFNEYVKRLIIFYSNRPLEFTNEERSGLTLIPAHGEERHGHSKLALHEIAVKKKRQNLANPPPMARCAWNGARHSGR